VDGSSPQFAGRSIMASATPLAWGRPPSRPRIGDGHPVLPRSTDHGTPQTRCGRRPPPTPGRVAMHVRRILADPRRCTIGSPRVAALPIASTGGERSSPLRGPPRLGIERLALPPLPPRTVIGAGLPRMNDAQQTTRHGLPQCDNMTSRAFAARASPFNFQRPTRLAGPVRRHPQSATSHALSPHPIRKSNHSHAETTFQGRPIMSRPMMGFTISFVPPKILCTRASWYARAIGYTARTALSTYARVTSSSAATSARTNRVFWKSAMGWPKADLHEQRQAKTRQRDAIDAVLMTTLSGHRPQPCVRQRASRAVRESDGHATRLQSRCCRPGAVLASTRTQSRQARPGGPSGARPRPRRSGPPP
jgi:hypothetical protein